MLNCKVLLIFLTLSFVISTYQFLKRQYIFFSVISVLNLVFKKKSHGYAMF